VLAESRVSERLQRLVQTAQLVNQGREALAGVEAAVERPQLGVQPVEPLQQRVQLTVADLLALHGHDSTSRRA